MNAVLELGVGTRIFYEGETWTVAELSPTGVLLTSGSGMRRTQLSHLVAHGRFLDVPGHEPQERPSVASHRLQPLDPATEKRAEQVRALLVIPAESTSLADAYSGTAKELGVSVRTLHRWVARYQQLGPAGLVGQRASRRRPPGVDARWDVACLEVLKDHVDSSTPTKSAVLGAVRRLLEERFGDEAPRPSTATAMRRLNQLSKGRHAFGSGKGRRSVANRPDGPYGRLRATRPGEYVVLDTTPLDVFAMEPVTLRWVPVELTIAQDLFDRCILGLRLSPVSTRSEDVANVLYQCVAAREEARGPGDGPVESWPFHGVPRNVLVGTEVPDGVSQQRVGGVPACLPEAIVVDHGKVYLSAHVMSVCARMGITVQPAIPYKPTDKPTVERFFKTLRESLLQYLPAYKGPDVYSRGKDVEGQAFLYVAELEQIIREWVGTVYHHTKHAGLCVPEVPGAVFCPAEMFEIGLAKAGGLVVPSRPGLAFEFLEVAWRTVQHYGVEVGGLRYDGPALNLYRNRRSSHGGVHAGKWPIFVDAHDVRFVHFQDPDTRQWHRLAWEHAPALGQPFSADALEHAKKIALRTGRHVDPQQAVQDLLADWSKGQVESRRDRSLARRISAQRAADDAAVENGGNGRTGADTDPQEQARQVASLPGVVDLLTRRRDKAPAVVDDVDDVFERWYAAHPDAQGLEVFDE